MKTYRKITSILSLLSVLLTLTLIGCTQATPTAEPAQDSQPEASEPDPTSPTADDLDEATGPWQIIREAQADHNVRMAAFWDENLGVTAGPEGNRTHYTTDGGQTWILSDYEQRCVYGLDIVDEQVIWQCNKGTASVSTDGGQTWEVRGTSNHSCRISFADIDTGWIYVPYGDIQATNDGGETWEEITPPEDVTGRTVIGMLRRTENDGYLLDDTGVLHITTDGGQTWRQQQIDLAAYGTPIDSQGMPVAAIRFFNADEGLIAVSILNQGARVIVLRTEDGGQTWTDEAALEGDGGALHLSDDGTLLTVHSLLHNGAITVLQYQSQ